MPTKARYVALEWFRDHEVLGPDEVFKRRPPSARMRRLMAKEGEAEHIPVGQFGLVKWRLTDKGREVLGAKPAKRRHKPRVEK